MLTGLKVGLVIDMSLPSQNLEGKPLAQRRLIRRGESNPLSAFLTLPGGSLFDTPQKEPLFIDIYFFFAGTVTLSSHWFSCGFHAESVRTGCSRAVPYGGMLSIVQMIGFKHWLAFTFCFELVMAETRINCWDGVEKSSPSEGRIHKGASFHYLNLTHLLESDFFVY